MHQSKVQPDTYQDFETDHVVDVYHIDLSERWHHSYSNSKFRYLYEARIFDRISRNVYVLNNVDIYPNTHMYTHRRIYMYEIHNLVCYIHE